MIEKPNLFIVGAPRCGTTSMYDYLKQHPDVFMPEVKEPHFLGTDLTSSRFIRDEGKYQALFATAKNEKRIGEASVWQLYSKIAAYEIKEYSPTARVIIMLRNPVDMMYSLYGQHIFSGDEEISDFEEAL